MLTNGIFSWPIQTLSDLTCKFFNYVYNVVEMISDYSMVVFATERICVILFPMRALSRSYSRFCMYLLALLVILAVAINVEVIIAIIRYMPPGNTQISCAPDATNRVLFLTNSFLRSFVVSAFPTILLAALNVVIIAALYRIARKRHALTHSGTASLPTNSKENSTTATLVILSAFQCALYLPFSVLSVAYALLATKLVTVTAPSTTTTIIYAYFIFFYATAYTKGFSFIVYYLRVPFFQESVNRAICSNPKRK